MLNLNVSKPDAVCSTINNVDDLIAIDATISCSITAARAARIRLQSFRDSKAVRARFAP